MSNTAIKVENLSKKYIIGHQQSRNYKTFRESLTQNVKNIGQKLLKPFSKHVTKENTESEEFWALRDICFEIKSGDRLGIIGRNGAGKSTLLKILSRITEPTAGDIWINGCAASLLEVGTGFHPELTGRENIFLNGAILGMPKSEIKQKFDEIVAFSEIEKFLDTPVKRYSSGMYVRLAFAVAAHLEPEILIVDEVLAVGDIQFQKKCLGKMKAVGKTGRTVLFVSHNMAAIQNLCSRCILLNHGGIYADDKTDTVIKKYIEESSEMMKISLADRHDRSGDGTIRFISLTLKNESGDCVNSFICGKKSIFCFSYDNASAHTLRNLQLSIGIDNAIGERVTFISNETTNEIFPEVRPDFKNIEICIEKLPLLPGRYDFTIHSTVNGVLADWIQNAGYFQVESGDYYGSGKLPPSGQGDFVIDYKFKIC